LPNRRAISRGTGATTRTDIQADEARQRKAVRNHVGALRRCKEVRVGGMDRPSSA